MEEDLPGDLAYLALLYGYLQKKVCSTEKLMCDYIASTRNRYQKFKEGVGEALLEEHAVTKGKGGLLGNKVIYIPEKGYREDIIRIMTTFFTISAKQAVREQRIPFDISMDIPNEETREAIEEVRQMKKNPSLGKSYTDVDKMMKELLA